MPIESAQGGARVTLNDAPATRAEMRAELEGDGFHLIPLRAGSKLARVQGWPDVSKQWKFNPSDNVGIFTGAHRDGGALLVLDVDSKPGRDGEASLRALEDEHGPLPVTREHTTASGGRHLIFRAPAAVQSSAGRLGAGLDVRSDGGYIVSPGSVVGGKLYTVSCGGPIADAPQWLIESCGQRRERDAKAAEPLPGVDAERARKRAVEYLTREAPEAVEGAGGDETTFKVAAKVKDLGVSQEECTVLMLEHWNDRCVPPWSPDDLAVKVTNAYSYGLNRQGSDAPEAVFEPVPSERTSVVSGGEELALRRPMTVIDLRRFEELNLPPQRFIVDKIVPAGLPTLLGGHGGAGKSVLALAFAAHVAAERPAYGLSVEGGPAIYVSLEDDRAWMLKRLRKIAEVFGLNPRTIEANLRIIDGTGAGALMRESGQWGASLAETAAMRELRAMSVDASVIFIDNATDAFDGNENVRPQVKSFVRALNTLGHDDTAVVLLAHIDKAAARNGSSGNTYSGSTAWHNTTRSRLALLPAKGNGDAVELHHEKWSRTTQMPAMRLEWSPEGVLIPATGFQGSTADEDADDVLRAIEAATKDGASVPTARTGTLTTQHALERFPDLPRRLHGSAGRTAFWAAVTTLHRSGRIKVDEYKNDNRKARTRYVLAAPVCASSAPVWN